MPGRFGPSIVFNIISPAMNLWENLYKLCQKMWLDEKNNEVSLPALAKKKKKKLTFL